MDEMENRLARLPGALLPWYRENRRVLPWREQVSAYRTWAVSYTHLTLPTILRV